ncbi:hypothetical protein BDV18DRAFT_15527 [Aspergillus unguis]
MEHRRFARGIFRANHINHRWRSKEKSKSGSDWLGLAADFLLDEFAASCDAWRLQLHVEQTKHQAAADGARAETELLLQSRPRGWIGILALTAYGLIVP